MTFRVKHNGIWKEPESIHVKQNGSWVEADELFVKNGGSWQSSYTSEIPPLVLIDYGYKNPILGGFLYDDCWNPPGTSRVGTTGSFFYNDNDGISVNAPYWGCGTAFSNNHVNLTGVVSASITFSWSGVAHHGGGSMSWPLANGTRQSYGFRSTGGPANMALTTVTVAVSNPGIGDIQFGVGNTNGGRIYLHKLVFNYA